MDVGGGVDGLVAISFVVVHRQLVLLGKILQQGNGVQKLLSITLAVMIIHILPKLL